MLLAQVPVEAQEAPAADELAQIREMMLYARYREALPQLRIYLARTNLSAAQRNNALEVLATIAIAMRDRSGAQHALNELYSRDPGHQLNDPDASPPVLSAFGRARSNPPHLVEVAIENHTTAALERRGPPHVDVELGAGRNAVDELRLRYRQGEDTAFNTVVMAVGNDGRAEARIPILEGANTEYRVEYYVEALAPSDTVLAHLGSAERPLSITVPEGIAVAGTTLADGTVVPGGGDDFTWLLWTVIGLALIGGGVSAIVWVALNTGGADNGSLGNITLPLVQF